MKIGETHRVRGQRYECVGAGEPHENRFGRIVTLWPLETDCPDCGQRFRLLATDTAWRKGELTRRCPEHRRPGVAVRSAKPRPKLRWPKEVLDLLE